MKNDKFQTSSIVRRLTCITWLVTPALALLLEACASSHPSDQTRHISAPEVPDILKVPGRNKAFLHACATGVQIYVWTVNPTNSALSSWVFIAPQAALFNANGRLIGYHYRGPTWESKADNSEVEGVVLQKSALDASAIPWLLLKAKSTKGEYHDVFKETTYIQRVHTAGGLAPMRNGDYEDERVSVPYTAEYYFYRSNRAD